MIVALGRDREALSKRRACKTSNHEGR